MQECLWHTELPQSCRYLLMPPFITAAQVKQEPPSSVVPGMGLAVVSHLPPLPSTASRSVLSPLSTAATKGFVLSLLYYLLQWSKQPLLVIRKRSLKILFKSTNILGFDRYALKTTQMCSVWFHCCMQCLCFKLWIWLVVLGMCFPKTLSPTTLGKQVSGGDFFPLWIYPLGEYERKMILAEWAFSSGRLQTYGLF